MFGLIYQETRVQEHTIEQWHLLHKECYSNKLNYATLKERDCVLRVNKYGGPVMEYFVPPFFVPLEGIFRPPWTKYSRSCLKYTVLLGIFCPPHFY